VQNRLPILATVAFMVFFPSAPSQSPGSQTPQHSATKLSGPVTWGSPDQPYGKRRAVTAADRKAIQSYRSGSMAPIFSTNFTSPAELQSDWDLVSDDNQWGTFQSCRRPDNVVATPAGLDLKTMLATGCHHKWSTGYLITKARYGFGFFEATMKIADIKGMNNAFWMTTQDNPATGDHFEIDVTEAQFPSYSHIGLQQYPAKGNKTIKHSGMGWGASFADNLSSGFHDYGVLWTPNELIFEVDGEPIAAAVTNGAVHPPTDVAFSTALIYAGIPAHPEGHDVAVQSLRIFALTL
jgi:beta-glucanase (GH16 family)